MNQGITFPNEILLANVAQSIASGHSAVIPVKGISMHPFIHEGKDKVILYPPSDIRVGDVVLAKLSSGQYLLHRVYQCDSPDSYILMGDGNVKITEHCSQSEIIAQALFLIDSKGRKKRLDSPWMRGAAKIWKMLLPVRGILLKVYRKFIV